MVVTGVAAVVTVTGAVTMVPAAMPVPPVTVEPAGMVTDPLDAANESPVEALPEAVNVPAIVGV